MDKQLAYMATRALTTADDIVEAVVGSEGWCDILRNDPQIRAATQALEATIKGCANEGEVYDAALALAGASVDAAILYGIHVEAAIRSVSV